MRTPAKLVPLLTLVLLAAPACAPDSPSKPGQGPRPGCAADTVPPATWKINLSHGLDLHDKPFSGEPATGLGGHFYLGGRAGGPAPDPTAAVVTLNGAAVPLDGTAFRFDHMAARPAGVEAGGQVRVVATLAGECTSVEFTCPSFAITSPAEGAAVGAGETLVVTWQGALHYPSVASTFYRPAAAIDTYSAASNQRSSDLTYPVGVAVGAGDASVSLSVPPAAQGGYVVEVVAPGAAAAPRFDSATGDLGDVGLCMLSRRVHLTAR